MTTRTCKKCEVTKDLDEFPKKDKKHHRHICKMCSSKREWRPSKPTALELAHPGCKTCMMCGEAKPWAQFYLLPRGRYGLCGTCRGCCRARNIVYSNKYYNNNKKKHSAREARKRARLLQRTPPWLTPEHWEQMEHMYATRPLGYHVDHIVPLKGENVSGLHVPWNLQHLPGDENLLKSNKHG